MNSPGVDRQPISTAIQINKLTLHHPQFEHVIATHQKHSGIGHGFPSSPGRAELLAAKKCTTTDPSEYGTFKPCPTCHAP